MRFEIKNWVAINISEYKTKLLLHNIFLFYLNEEQKKKKKKTEKIQKVENQTFANVSYICKQRVNTSQLSVINRCIHL